MADAGAEASLVVGFTRKCVYTWQQRFSLFALPALAGDDNWKKRELWIALLPVIGAATLLPWRGDLPALTTALLAGYALARLTDIGTSQVAMLVFGGTHRPGIHPDLSRDRFRRLLILQVFVYVEVIALFATCYRWLHQYWPASSGSGLGEPTDPRFSSLYLSMSTMTTVGYGKHAPENWPTLGTALLQALLAILVITSSISFFLARLTSERESKREASEKPSTTRASTRCGAWPTNTPVLVRWIAPPAAILALVLVLYVTQGVL